MTLRKVLLVDDDDHLRKLFGYLLRKNGYEVDEAADGLEAIEKIVADPEYGLIVLDVMMPVLDGLSALARMRGELNIQTPVLLLTSIDKPAEGTGIQQCGVTEVAMKPLAHDEFVSRVNAMFKPTS